MKLKLSISTCPNDTFMFDAMLHRRIDTEGLDFDLTMADIEQLNAAALAGEPDITKLSYASFPLVADHYRILGSGSALGRGNGPLLVSRHKLYPDELRDARIAIPGEHTTANRLLSLFFPEASDKRVYLFSDIADAVLSDECDAGVLIHEGRFTYRGNGIAARSRSGRGVGETHFAAVAARSHRRFASTRRATGPDNRARIAPQHRICRAHPGGIGRLRQHHAQELSEEVTRSHIELFVNDHSVDLGAEGRRAVTVTARHGTFGIKEEEAFV